MRKIAVSRAALLVLSMFLLLAPAGEALAYYGDGETSAGNELGATTLDLSLRDLNNVVLTGLLFDIDGMVPEDEEVQSLRVKNDGVLGATYGAWSAQTDGDEALCNALRLKADREASTVYEGSLTGFNESLAGDISSGVFDGWEFTVSLGDDDASLEEKTCEFDLVFRGWQTDSDGTWGFTDEERVSNEVATGTWGAEPGDVVINEIMWMGSTESSYDEWIELRNTTDQEINVGQWEIENARESGDPALMIPAGKTIPAGGYLLIANYPEEANPNSVLNVPVDVVNASLSLANAGNGNLVLRDRYDNVVDEAKGDEWPEGYDSGGFKKSMERNDTPGDGMLAESWHTCLDDDGIDGDCNDGTFWDTADGNNYGTPKAANLSEGDPTSLDELRGAGPMSGDGEGEEPASGEDGSVNVAVEPTGTGAGQEESTGDGGSGAGDEVVWLGDEDDDVAGIGVTSEGDGDGGDAGGGNGESDSGSGETESNE